MTEAGALSLAAPAKLNLDLRIVGRRDDGFHLLESTMVLLELADRLLLMPGAPGLRVEGAETAAHALPVGGHNLAWRGLLAGLGGEPSGACLALEKRIPVAAGLGGGSSDAAAAWRLGRAWRGVTEGPGQDDFATLASIGADVPFFAARVAAARVEGIGERVTPLPAGALEVLLVTPPAALRTAEVFGELREDEWGSERNDLLAPALRLCPEIREVLALVTAAGGDARLTGSGPTVFAATDDPERARHVAERLRRAGLAPMMTRTRREAARIERQSEEE